MCTFYRGTIESILTSCITVWYGACNASCRKSLQRIVRAAEKIVGVSLPSLQDITETAESPGEDQQTEGQLHPSGCQEAELPPVLAPPSPLLPHAPLNSLFHWFALSTMCLMPLYPFFILLFLFCFIYLFFYMSLFVYL